MLLLATSGLGVVLRCQDSRKREKGWCGWEDEEDVFLCVVLGTWVEVQSPYDYQENKLN